MYFVSDEHHMNFRRLQKRFNRASDPEYDAACYINALPTVYKRMKDDTGSEPFLWIYRYEEYYTTEHDEDGPYRLHHLDIEKDENGEVRHSEAYGTLSGGYKRIVDLGRHLFNRSNSFELMDGIGVWGDELYKVFIQALLIRTNRQVEGLRVDIH